VDGEVGSAGRPARTTCRFESNVCEEMPVPHRLPLKGPLAVVGLTAAGLVAVVGGLALRGPGLVAVAVAGVLAACLGWGTARESNATNRRSNTETAVLAAAWTVGVLLVLSGASVLAGGVAAAILAGGAAVLAIGLWIARTPKEGSAKAPAPTASGNVAAPVAPLRPTTARLQPPVTGPSAVRPVTELSTEELGREWLEGTAALAGQLEPATRTSLVRRRQDALDELERRDPDGFLRWLTTGPVLERDPARFVRGRRTAGESPAGTDAA
jgi:hypothetical protein